MDHTPPPFFKRGPAPLVRLFFFATLSLALLVVDARFHYVEGLRSWLALAAYPLQRAALLPFEVGERIAGYFSTQTRLVAENERLRAIAFGGSASGMLELRFTALNAEVQNGDQLVTSGIDGTYPAGLPVATVVHIERDADHMFARVLCRPTAGVDRGQYVLVIANESAARPPRPDETQSGKDRREKSRRAKKA